MKMGWRMAWILAGLLLVPMTMQAQQQPAPAEKPAMTHLRVDLVLAEYSGDKKISSLSYTMYVGVGDRDHDAPRESIRMGVRVPIVTAAERTAQGTEVAMSTSYNSVG